MTELTRDARIHQTITEALAPDFIEVFNESNRHQRPGTETHYKVTVVSDKFKDLTRINRHRLINELCKPEFNTGLHALSMHLYTSEEWQARKQAIPNSPPCRNQDAS